MEFRYTPLVSGPAASRVSLHCSFDNWKADVMDYVEDDSSSYFVLFRMVPPGESGRFCLCGPWCLLSGCARVCVRVRTRWHRLSRLHVCG